MGREEATVFRGLAARMNFLSQVRTFTLGLNRACSRDMAKPKRDFGRNMKKNSSSQKAKKLQDNGVEILDIEKLEIRGNLECGKDVLIESISWIIHFPPNARAAINDNMQAL